MLSSILKHNYDADIYFDKVKRQQLLVVDCIAIRINGGKKAISNEAVCRLLEDYNRYLQRYGMLRVKHPLPGSCRQKMGKVEGVGSLPVGHQFIECSTSLSKTESCMHYWINQIPLLIEKLVASCEAQGKFETSIEFCCLINKICFGIGSGRGRGMLLI